jgi:hypothetical protein
MSSRGRKDDAGKPRFTLIPRRALGCVLSVLEHGATKYGAGNWRNVEGWKDRYTDALMRHLLAWRSGERFDEESGEHHLAHAACCVLFLLGFEVGDE